MSSVGTHNQRTSSRWPVLLFALGLAATLGCERANHSSPPTLEQTGTGRGLISPTAELPDVTPRPEPDENVVALVNDIPILRSDIDRRLWRRLGLVESNDEGTSSVQRNRVRRQILDELVQRELLEQHAAEIELFTSEDELDGLVDERLSELFRTDAQFEQYLEQRGMSETEYRAETRHLILVDRLIESQVDIQATEEDVYTYYEQYRENWRASERVRAAAITIRLARDADDETDATALSRITELREMAQSPDASFEDIAFLFSQSPDSSRGGEMGWVYRDDEELESRILFALFSLAVGEISEPVRTHLGYQIFIVYDHRPEGFREFEEIRDNLYEIVVQRQAQTTRLMMVRDLEEQAEVVYVERNLGLEDE